MNLNIEISDEDYKNIIENGDFNPLRIITAIENGVQISAEKISAEEKKDSNVADVYVYLDWDLYDSIKIGDITYTRGVCEDGRTNTFNGDRLKKIAIQGGTQIIVTASNGNRCWRHLMDGNNLADKQFIGSGNQLTFTVPKNVSGSGSLDFDGFYENDYTNKYDYCICFDGNWISNDAWDSVIYKTNAKRNTNVFVYVDWSLYDSIQIGNTIYTMGKNRDGKDNTFNGEGFKSLSIPAGTRIVATGSKSNRNWNCNIANDGTVVGSGNQAIFTIPAGISGPGSLDFHGNSIYSITFNGAWGSDLKFNNLGLKIRTESTPDVYVYVDWNLYDSVKIGNTTYTKGKSNDGRKDTFNSYNSKIITIPGGTEIVATGSVGDRSWGYLIDNDNQDGFIRYISNDNGIQATFTVPTDVSGSGGLRFGSNIRDCVYGIRFDGEWCSNWSSDDIKMETEKKVDIQKDANDPKATVFVHVDWTLFSSIQIGDTTYIKGVKDDKRTDTFNGNDAKFIDIPGGTTIVAIGSGGFKDWYFDINGPAPGHYGNRTMFTVPADASGSGNLNIGDGNNYLYYVGFGGDWCSDWSISDIHMNSEKDANIAKANPNTAEVLVYVDWSAFRSIQINNITYTQGISGDERDDTFNGGGAKFIDIPSNTKIIATGSGNSRNWRCCLNDNCYGSVNDGNQATFTVPTTLGSGNLCFDYNSDSRYYVSFEGEWCSSWSRDDLEVKTEKKDEVKKGADDPDAIVFVHVDWHLYDSIQIGDTTYTKGENYDERFDTFNGMYGKRIDIPSGTTIVITGSGGVREWHYRVDGKINHIGHGNQATFTMSAGASGSGDLYFARDDNFYDYAIGSTIGSVDIKVR